MDSNNENETLRIKTKMSIFVCLRKYLQVELHTDCDVDKWDELYSMRFIN